ncbi:MAG: YfcZ/YiiS family protein [Enterobacteriaceae bacterium]|jgi:uncharacterized protein (TIGR00743 family)|nr:YfcZ/YiiS family protein [Enterobacteriaceae bacterium]
MIDTIKRCSVEKSVEETSACCCVDVGMVIDNEDKTASYQQLFASVQEAKEMLNVLTKKAKSVESAPCTIKDKTEEIDGKVQLTVEFKFSCQAEAMIFQLGLR